MRKLLSLCLAPSMAFALDNSNPERLEGFWSDCFSCVKKTKEVVRDVHDISGDIIHIAKEVDQITTGGKHADRIKDVQRYFDKAEDVLDMIDQKSSPIIQDSPEVAKYEVVEEDSKKSKKKSKKSKKSSKKSAKRKSI